MSNSLLTNKLNWAARLSLSFLWIFTGITSAFFAREEGLEVLARGGITGQLADACLYSGSILDVAIGVWILIGKRLEHCYLVQIWVVLVYSSLLTIIDANFWLHPFGPLTKNIPILVMIYFLYSDEKLKVSNRNIL